MKRLSKSRLITKCLTQGLFAATILLAFCVATLATAENVTNFCLKTSRDVLKSCQGAANSDLSLAIAKCDNLATAAERSVCTAQAPDDNKDALLDCKDEFDVRQTACEQLGPAPYSPVIDPANFVSQIDNPYFPLTPGTTFVYEGQTSQGLEHDEFFITKKTRVILGVTCVEVRDTVRLNGKLAEDTLDWFAQDIDGNVWYFGENTHELEGGLITTIDGTFLSGIEGAKPGIVMEAHPGIGDFYRQEFDLGNAEDFAEVAGLNASVTVPFGTFNKCLRTHETTPLEPDLLEDKFYCRGVGNVLAVDRVTGERVELIQIK